MPPREKTATDAELTVLTAEQVRCLFCSSVLHIIQHRNRAIRQTDGTTVPFLMRDKGCPNPNCPHPEVIYRPSEELFLALPGGHFSRELVIEVGFARFKRNLSFPQIHAHLVSTGADISLTGVQDQLRHYLALVNSQVGVRDETVVKELRAQGGIIPVIDGVQFGNGESVLYIIIDAISGRPLFAREMKCRGAKDLAPFIAQLKDLEALKVRILAVVSDKEKGLVPAIERALPGVKHQFCQKHYLGRVASFMDEDLKALGQEVREVEERLRAVERELEHKQAVSGPIKKDVLLELCMAARAEARRSGRSTTAPPALLRHDGLERVSRVIAEIRQKKEGPRICAR